MKASMKFNQYCKVGSRAGSCAENQGGNGIQHLGDKAASFSKLAQERLTHVALFCFVWPRAQCVQWHQAVANAIYSVVQRIKIPHHPLQADQLILQIVGMMMTNGGNDGGMEAAVGPTNCHDHSVGTRNLAHSN